MKVIYKFLPLLIVVLFAGNSAYADKLAADKPVEKVVVEDATTSCDYFDDTLVNVLNLESSSLDVQQKIAKVENTIDDESVVRESIFSSIKGFFGLQKTDKAVLSDMKDDIQEAKDYYAEVDDKVASTTKYLDDNFCENVKVDKAKNVAKTTQNTVDDEAVYRKKFVASLKEKLKIIQDEVKNAKK